MSDEDSVVVVSVADDNNDADRANNKQQQLSRRDSFKDDAISTTDAGDDEEDGDEDDEPGKAGTTSAARIDDKDWKYVPPPRSSKITVDYYGDDLEGYHQTETAMKNNINHGVATPLFARFNSDFCSGNLAAVTRVAPTKFELRVANDNMGAPWATNNKMWFYFSVTGVPHGTTVSFVLTQMPFVKTYTYGYAPCVSVDPIRPTPTRLPVNITFTPAPLPPGVNERKQQQQQSTAAATTSKAAAAAATVSKDPQYCHVMFDYCFDAVPRLGQPAPTQPLTYYFAFGHPYSYEKLQRHIGTWFNNFGPEAHVLVPQREKEKQQQQQQQAQPPIQQQAQQSAATTGSVNRRLSSSALAGATSSTSAASSNNNTSNNNNPNRFHPVMYRELLTRTLDGNRVDLLTITARPVATATSPASANDSPRGTKARRAAATAAVSPERESRFGTDEQMLPMSSSSGNSSNNQEASSDTTGAVTKRPPHFPGRKYVVLSARVHPGEVPASHVMHGCIEFLLNTEDPRAAALRDNFVFVIVPMVNPDGVVRGYTRADSCGCNLNRMYKNPSRVRHPSVWAIRQLLLHLANRKALALYVDMHAHANKRGAFFYGNAMPGPQQVENLLFTKLVSLNTPFFGFNDCNFTNSNMYSLGKTGMCRDGSGRVACFLETGAVHCYTLECNSVVGPPLGAVAPLPQRNEEERFAGAPCPRYTPQIFHDMGRGVLLALLDMHGVNPLSRIPNTAEFRNVQAVRAFIGACLYTDALEQMKKKRGNGVGDSVLIMTPETRAQQLQSLNEPIDVDADGPVTTIIGPRQPLPPTTTTGEIGKLQGYVAQAQASGAFSASSMTALMRAPPSRSSLSFQQKSQARRASAASSASSCSSSSASSAASSPLNPPSTSNNNKSALRLAAAGKQTAASSSAVVSALGTRSSSLKNRRVVEQL